MNLKDNEDSRPPRGSLYIDSKSLSIRSAYPRLPIRENTIHPRKSWNAPIASERTDYHANQALDVLEN